MNSHIFSQFTFFGLVYLLFASLILTLMPYTYSKLLGELGFVLSSPKMTVKTEVG